jgi:hypothetical protein
MTTDYELEEQKKNLKPSDELVVTFKTKAKEKKPSYIVVGNGIATKAFPEKVSKDAFKVFSELSKAQQGLFIDFKEILVQQQMNSRYKKQETESPNFIRIVSDKDNYLHQSIKKRMAVNKNGSTLEEKEVLQKIKNGHYMLNPYIFIPANNFKEAAKIWEELAAR